MSDPIRTAPASKNSRSSRRQFLKSTAGAGLGAMAMQSIVPSSVLGAEGQVAPKDRVTLGVIGTGNQGINDMRAFLGDERVQVVAVCDVNRESAGYWDGAVAGREPGRRVAEEFYAKRNPSGTHKGVAAYEDYREMIARKDIDAVLIATPDHWHAILAIEAAKAGKDIYGQKPLSLTVMEGRAMSDAVKKHGRIFQCGSQQRSDRIFRHGCELVRNGRIGKLQTVTCGLPGGHPDFGKNANRKKPEPVPDGMNYEMWLGPAPWAPYAPARVGVNYRWNLDYSGGQLTDWGGHHPDIAQWGMGTEHTGPVEINNPKADWPPAEALWNTATSYYFECIYKDGVKMIVTDKARGGVTFQGADGSVWVTRGGFATEPKSLWESEIGSNETRLYRSDNHYRNFIDCVLSRREPIAPCEAAHRSITIAHLGNIAMLLGRNLKWDPEREQIAGDPSAQWMLDRPHRSPWSLPAA
jgi:predicted dehydrogenase